MTSSECLEVTAEVVAKCRICFRFTATINSLCRRCTILLKNAPAVELSHSLPRDSSSAVIGFSYSDSHLIPTRSNKAIIPREEWAILSSQVEEFYARADQKVIDAYNAYNSRLLRLRPGRAAFDAAQGRGKWGFVYLLRSENGFHKIGRTTDVEKRLLAIQQEFPIGIKLMHYFECHDAPETERHLHRIYAAFRMSQNREWFKLPAGAIDHICSVEGPVRENELAGLFGGTAQPAPLAQGG